MKKLQIITGENNPILRQKSKEVRVFNSTLKNFANAMRVAMNKADGLGLAAPQVGENLRMVLVTLNYNSDNQMLVAMVNPVILSHNDEMALDEEGCLSLPGVFGKVPRYTQISMKFQDLDGTEIRLNLKGLNARVVQHETDHLDGVLFVDKMKGKASAVEVEVGSKY
jgi:peptide deformylase